MSAADLMRTVLGVDSIYHGRKIKGSIEFDELIRKGFDYKVGDRVRGRLNISNHDFAGLLDISERTLTRIRRSPNKRFSLIASDRLFRLVRIFVTAWMVLEDENAAKEWLHRPQFGLGGKVPLDLIQTEAGAKEVEDLLLRIEYGVLA